jgi:site-specific DNA-methyltransferase (adenine-specific)
MKETLEINKIYNEDCLETMAKMPDNFIDLTVTSPPYDDLRTYNSLFDLDKICNELYRITKQGGVCVWVVGDKSVNGSESGTSFKQALKFMQCGWNLHDTMIFKKKNPMPYIKKNCYTQAFEYMFVFSKGTPKTANMLTEPCNYAGVTITSTNTNEQSMKAKKKVYHTKDEKIRHNVFEYVLAGTNYGHPAIFPKQLAVDHIKSWSNEGDLIFDCFMGSGTTAKMAIENNRNYIGSEISEEYCSIANNRIQNYLLQQKLF